MSLLDAIAGDPLTPEGAFAQAANRQTPFSQYLGAKATEGVLAMRPVQALVEATTPGREHGDPSLYMGGATDEFGRLSPLAQAPPALIRASAEPRLPKAAWENGPHAREGIVWDEGMTEARAQSLAAAHDAATYRASLVARYSGGPLGLGSAAGFIAGALPGLADPTNFIPILGEASEAAMVARLGTILGHGLVAAGDAAANTALFEPLAANRAREIGQDFGASDVATDILGNALAGSLFGLGKGWLHDRAATREALLRTGAKGLPRVADGVNLVAAQLDAGLPADVGPVLKGAPEMREPVPPPGIDAWHGSPHTFDRFSAQKIDTGEGDQAFGHGLYFAEHRDTAEMYRRNITEAHQRQMLGEPGAGDRAATAAGLLNADVPRENVEAALQSLEPAATAEQRAAWIEEGQARVQKLRDAGNLYKVRLAVDSERLLDWNKSMSAQPPAAREAVGKLWREAGNDEAALDGMSGAEVYQTLAHDRGQPEASRLLHEAGLHGMQHLDGIGQEGGGVRNFVVFDETRVHALERNGQPLDWSKGTPFEPHPSVAEAADRVGKNTPELETFAKDAGLDGYDKPLPGHEPEAEGVTVENFKPKLGRTVEPGEVLTTPGVVVVRHKTPETFAEVTGRSAEEETAAAVARTADGRTEIHLGPNFDRLGRAAQFRALAHEEGHVLQRAHGKEATPDILAGMEKLSREARPDYWKAADEGKDVRVGDTRATAKPMGGAELKAYLTSADELFADAWSIAKTRPRDAEKLAPEVMRFFEERVGPRDAWERNPFAKPKAGIEPPAPGPPPGEPDLPPELLDIEALRRAGELPEGADAILAAGEKEARTAEAWGDAYAILSSCVLKAAR